MQVKRLELMAFVFAAALVTALTSALTIALVWRRPALASFDDGSSMRMLAAEPVTPFGTFPLQLTFVLLGVLVAWTVVNTVWTAPRAGAVAAIRRLLGHPKVGHLYLPVIVGVQGSEPRAARLFVLGEHRTTLLSRAPLAPGERISLVDDATRMAPVHARVTACRPHGEWYEVEARISPESKNESAALSSWLDRLDPRL